MYNIILTKVKVSQGFLIFISLYIYTLLLLIEPIILYYYSIHPYIELRTILAFGFWLLAEKEIACIILFNHSWFFFSTFIDVVSIINLPAKGPFLFFFFCFLLPTNSSRLRMLNSLHLSKLVSARFLHLPRSLPPMVCLLFQQHKDPR